jgi:hypothetical protein
MVALVWGVGLAAALPAHAEQFRFDNKVFVDERQEPQIQSTTIFMDGVVYDFLESPDEVIVFDTAHGRFVLLDLTRRVQTKLSAEQVASLTERLREWAKSQSDPYLQFMASPSFDEEFDGQTGELSLTSEWMTYRLGTAPAASEGVSRRYREFSDWYCRLNTAINPGSRPPFARLMVNAALDARHLLPREVVLTLRPKQGLLSKKITVRSEHQLIAGLAESDRNRVAQVGQFMAIFNPLSFEQYQAKIDN